MKAQAELSLQQTSHRQVGRFPDHPRSPGQRRTEKASCARLKHGMYSRYTVIPGESRQEYADLRAELFDDLRPQGRVETILAEQMVQAQWKLQRLWMREAGVYMEFEQRRPLGNTPLPLQLRACARQDSHSRAAGELDKLTLDQARCLNQFQRTLRAFTALRDQRRKGFVSEKDEATPSTLGQPGESVDRGAEDGEAPVTASQPVGDAPAEDTANLAPSDSSDGASGEIVDREAGGGRGVASLGRLCAVGTPGRGGTVGSAP